NDTQDNERKSQLLYETFFRPPPEDDFVDPNYAYDTPICDFQPITDQQIQRAIERLAPHKVPGPNSISNIVFTKCMILLVPYLSPIFRATFQLNVYPDEWKQPITLLDSMAKILSSCIADDLTYIAEQHNLLPPTHFG
ncbi:hypothetical protein BDR05DRAFT_834535, partial [Suillus weaverae]